MDLPTRLVVALLIIGASVLIVSSLLIVRARKRRAELPRRRGVKSYNRTGKASNGQ
jgi:hypothetical protein